jgi:hypothetical protein
MIPAGAPIINGAASAEEVVMEFVAGLLLIGFICGYSVRALRSKSPMMESVYDLKPIYTNSVRVKLTDRKDRENDSYVEYDLTELHHMPMLMLESAIEHIKDHPDRVGNLVADAFKTELRRRATAQPV